MLTEFPISGNHYFCETVDITRPFPSGHPVSEPSWEFVWNYYLTQPFRRVGLGAVVPHMLQGLAEQRSLPDLLGKLFTVGFIARRSRLHAGTRYLSLLTQFSLNYVPRVWCFAVVQKDQVL
jgi:hypothetical protein